MNVEQAKSLLKPLLGKQISFFDETGGVLNDEKKYLDDWWNEPVIALSYLSNDSFEVINTETAKSSKHFYSDVLEIERNEITMNYHDTEWEAKNANR